MRSRVLQWCLEACAAAALCLSGAAFAQEAGLGDGSDSSTRSERSARGEYGVQVNPYIEASQILVAELSPGDDVVTFSQIAVGVDASVTGRSNGGSVSVRYERTIGYDDASADSGTLSGVARGYATIVPRALTIEGGALAARTRIDANGGSSLGAVTGEGATSTVYSAYAGPNLHTSAGDVEINANYRIGYTEVDASDAVVTTGGGIPVDVFGHSVSQAAAFHLATRPGAPLPVGLGVGGGYNQEDISNFDQRLRDIYIRADVTVPVSHSLALVAGAGYEDVEISSRDALLDASGDPVIGSDGRIVTDTSEPRQLAYDVSGLIWDVGVVWRPSRRTSLEAHVGRRYDSTSYYGTFAWAPSSRTGVSVSVYDAISGFGSQLNTSLANLPTQFAATRNAVTGDLSGCVATTQGNNCLAGVLGSVRSATYRSRGIAASYSVELGRTTAGVGAGYDRRSFIAAPGTILAAANSVQDENYWVAFYLAGELGSNAGFSANAYANWLDSGFSNAGDVLALGASAAYRRQLLAGLSARAALALDHLDSRQTDQDFTAASALLGLRYDF
ncbi:preprotein translocase subunit YajC [Allopontixanthobacter sp.]|uniref:preprotein translocase subunit YajC n=1 Tax=Allopontixanthobacter sp. TaxID=2906452 RepID=UPI002ABBED05|nr:preprotein translocase subunit YajC [Allopontixanthobacter sp.]MDZ4308060.1 preprotein translocase subunit YajC [Allopontixanthobacter sp.]